MTLDILRTTAAASAAALLISCGLAACTAAQTAGDRPSDASSERDASAAPGLQTAPDLKFQDVPVPYGFRYEEARSTVLEAGAFRSGVLVYSGTASLEELVPYYLEEMTRYDWRPISKVEDRGKTTLLFEKPGLVCTVEVSKGFGRSATIKVTYVPKGSAGRPGS